MKELLRLTSIILIQAFIIGEISGALRMEFPADKSPERNSFLSPQLNLQKEDMREFFQRALSLQKPHGDSAITPMPEPSTLHLATQTVEPVKVSFKQRISSLLTKLEIRFYAYILLHVNNQKIRTYICRQLINRNDLWAFNYLNEKGIKWIREKGKVNKLARLALAELYQLEPELDSLLHIKDTLYAYVRSKNYPARNAALKLLDKMGIRSERGLDNILHWIRSGSWFLSIQGLRQIKKFGPKRLEKIKKKGIIPVILQMARNNNISETMFMEMADVLKLLNVDPDEMAEFCVNVLSCRDNHPSVRARAISLLGKIKLSPGKKTAMRQILLSDLGVKSRRPAVRLAAIKVIGELGEPGDIRPLEELLKTTHSRVKYATSKIHGDLFEPNKEYSVIVDAILKLKFPIILSLYDSITRKHIENVYQLVQIFKRVYTLDDEDAKILSGVALKHDLGKSSAGYYDVVAIPAKLKPGDDILEKFRTEHSFISDYLISEYGIMTPLEEELIIRNHHRPDILLADQDFLELPADQKLRIRKLLEIFMVIDGLCGYTEIFRPPNWFDNVSLDTQEMANIISQRYSGLKYEFVLNVKEIVSYFTANKKAMEILRENTKQDAAIIAAAMKSWKEEREYYSIILRGKILELKTNDLAAAKKFLAELVKPAMEEAFQNGEEQKLKQGFLDIIDAFLKNPQLHDEIKLFLNKLEKDHPASLFAQTVRRHFLKELAVSAQLRDKYMINPEESLEQAI